MEEIGSLRRVIDRQGEMLVKLMGLVEAQASERGVSPGRREGNTAGSEVPHDSGLNPASSSVPLNGKRATAGGELDEDQFALGSDDETES